MAVSIAVLVALISAGVAVCGAVMTALTTTRSIRLQNTLSLQRARLERLEASEDLTRRYREPLLLAAFHLQARIYNMVQTGFIARHLNSADAEERSYARASTLYRLGDYLGWIEILRRDLQFLDLGEERKTAELVERLDAVSHTFSNTEWFPASVFRLFRDEQRALGEVMLESVGGEPGRCQCIGYATFVERLEQDAGFARWFNRLSAEIDKLINPAPGQLDRLIEVQHELINVISFLDPDSRRFPVAHIKHVDAVSTRQVSADPRGGQGT
jgi:hypothetical protein